MTESAHPALGAATAAGVQRRARLSARKRQRYLAFLLLIAPVMLLRGFTSIYPVGHTAYLSLFRLSPLDQSGEFVGLANYALMLDDFQVQGSIFFTVLFVLASTALELAIGLPIALMLNAEFRGRQFVRTINLIPWAIPAIVSALLWRWLFDDQFGPIAQSFSALSGQHTIILGDAWGARVATIVANVWKNAPFVAVVLLAGLQGISSEVYEAARMDGASGWQVLWRITVPLLAPLITTITMFFVIWQLATFDLIYGMTSGGPGFATAVLSHRAYEEAFRHLNLGYAAAISMVLFGLVAIVGLLGTLVIHRQETY